MPSTAPLTKANYATVVGYALYPIMFSAFEAVGYSTLPSNADVSSRYQVGHLRGSTPVHLISNFIY